MLNSFWWSSGTDNNKGIKWLSWENMSRPLCKGGLGFRNLHGFNIALLGKHCWKFIQQPQALVSRVFKARYFDNTHLLKAQKGTGSSFIWLGIHEAKEALLKGFRWVLGDGEDIVAVKDHWLRKKSDFKVVNSHRYEGRNEKVAQLMLSGLKQWDYNLIRASFHEEDANAILAINVPQGDIRDRVAWTQSVNGRYDVKTGYKMWFDQNGSTSVVPQISSWSKIWKVEVPHKIRIFLWRFCRNNIPVKSKLRHKGVPITIMCPMCNRDVEHLLHVFFDCQFATQCWSHVGLFYDMSMVTFAPDWLLQRINEGTELEVSKIAIVLWGIWSWRNKKVWEDKLVSPAMTMDWSSKIVSEWRRVTREKRARIAILSSEKLAGVQKWCPPEEGKFKINVDAAVVGEAETCSVGMVLRDCRGQFLEGKVMNFLNPESVFAAEARGVCEALLWAKERDLQNVIIETDSLLTVRALRMKSLNVLEVGNVLQMCLKQLKENPTFSIVFVQRQANKVAHEMAKIPCLANCYNLFTSPPEVLLETILFEALI